MHRKIRVFIAYPVIFLLTIVFISPTIPFDLSLLMIVSILGALGLRDGEKSVVGVGGFASAWLSELRRKLQARWNG